MDERGFGEDLGGVEIRSKGKYGQNNLCKSLKELIKSIIVFIEIIAPMCMLTWKGDSQYSPTLDR